MQRAGRCVIEGEKAGREFARDISITPVKSVDEGIEVCNKIFKQLQEEGWTLQRVFSEADNGKNLTIGSFGLVMKL
jgi:hypothetical protein